MSAHLPLPRQQAMIVLAGTLIGCLVVIFLILRPFLPALVWSLTLAVMLAPAERRLRKRVRSPGLSVTIMLLLAGVAIVIPAMTVSAALMREVLSGADAFRTLISAKGLADLGHRYPDMAALLERLGHWLYFPQSMEYLTAQLGRWTGQFVQGSATSLINFLVTFYFLFYLLRDRARALAALERMMPLSREELAGLIGKTTQTVFASVYGTVAVAALQGLLGGTMFWILGLPSPVFWGIIMGLLAIVPFLGAFVIWVPAAIALALSGHWGAAIMLAGWGTLVVGLIDNIIYPILVGKRLSLHPMVSFIAIVGGLVLFGAHGIVLGPLAVAMAQALLQLWRARMDEAHPPPAGT